MSDDLTTTQIYFETREFCHRDAYRHLSNLRKAIFELKMNYQKTLKENTLYWEKEIEKVKKEKDEEWRKIYNSLEMENETLKSELRNLTVPDTTDKHMCYKNLLLWEAEGQIQDLNKKLDQKQILINQLQSALAEQSKAMLEIEKDNYLLQLKYKRAVCKKDQPLKNHFNHCIIENNLNHPN